MRLVVGLDLEGATRTAPEVLSIGSASVGQATWGPTQLLGDLELRLGLVAKSERQALRVARWQARIASISGRGRYYSRSFEIDPIGTAEALLRLRDTLVSAGWSGEPIESGGRRLDALHELERLDEAQLPLGTADRLALVDGMLMASPRALYVELLLAESIELWPSRWQRVFRSLERAGTNLGRFHISLPGAPAGSDLGAIQAVLGEASTAVAPTIRGDGSLVHLSAETSWLAACSAAAVLAPLDDQQAVIIRDGDHAALEGALGAHGLRTQGLSSATPWRSASQVLPLSLELSFEPKDPYHVLELLTLPVGPFQGRVGHELARVLADRPGIGGPSWQAAKAELRGDGSLPARALGVAMVEEWLETRGAGPVTGAAKAELLAVVARVRTWILLRIASAPDDLTLLSAAQQSGAMAAALDADPRQTLSLAEVRKLAASVLSVGAAIDLTPEQAGRLQHVDSSAGLWAPCPVLVWWAFNDRATGSGRLPWRQSELLALSRAGLVFPDPQLRLAERMVAARRAFACATERVIFVSARNASGSSLGSHPLWDEIVARADLNGAAISKLSVASRHWLEGGTKGALLRPVLVNHASVELPGGRTEWAPDCTISPLSQLSHASLDALLGCPLRWVLRYRAGTYSGGHSLPSLLNLNGALGHRLVEVLHREGAFEGEESRLRERAMTVLAELYEREGALLLRAGMAFERSQLERQLLSSVVELSRTLRGLGLRVVAVEHPLDATYGTAQLEGRIDLVVANDQGAHAIIDMKWGIKTYRDQLQAGQALQLALYAFAHGAERSAPQMPDAAYFSLKQGKLFGLASATLRSSEPISGPSLAQTWQRAERSLRRVSQALEAKRLPVTGLGRSLPVLTALGMPESEHPSYFQHAAGDPCKYCSFDSLCGRRWEAMS
jgi:ATP-dependent helicase/nuclease subunit B